jgi:thiamine transport system substrate-binding protein
MKRAAIWTAVVLMMLSIQPLSAQDGVLTIIAHDSFNYSEDVMAAFEAQSGLRVEVLRLGDAGSMVNRAVLTRRSPLGDVMFGIDNTFLGRGLENDLFIPYASPMLESVDEAFIIDPEHRVTPIDFGDVCLNYDAAYFAANNLPLPTSLQDLTDPRYRGLLVVQNPATSSPGLAFLLTTVAVFGEDGYIDFWSDLIANETLIASDWTDAYYGQFSATGQGSYPLVVSYASSPPAEVFFAETPPETPPTGAIIADNTCFRQIEFAGILNGTDNLEGAQQFIDFLLSVEFQSDMPLQMFVFPVNKDAVLPEVFVEYAQIPENPVTLDQRLIDEKRDIWIQTWIENILR